MRWLIPFFGVLPFFPALNLAPGVDLAATRVIVLFAGAAWAAVALTHGSLRIPVTPPLVAIAAFFLLSGLSAFWAQEPSFAVRKAFFFLSLAPTVVLVAGATPQLRRGFLTALTWGAAASAVFGLTAFLSQFFFGAQAVAERIASFVAPFFFGASAAEAVALFPSWFIDVGTGAPFLRAFLPFPDPHTAALFWGVGLMLLTASKASQARRASKEYGRMKAQKNSIFSLLYPLSSLVLLTAIAATFSRGAYVALLGSAIAYGAWRIATASANRKSMRPPLFAARLVAFLVLLVLLVPLIGDRFLQTFDPHEGSVAVRLDLWQEALALFFEHPVLGVGLGNYAVAVDPFAPYRTPTNAHSTYLEIAAELGIVGLLLFVFALGAAAFAAARRSALGSRVHAAVFFALVFFAAHAFFEVNLYHPANLAALLTLLTVASLPPRSLKTN